MSEKSGKPARQKVSIPARGERLKAEARVACEALLRGAAQERLAVVVIVEDGDFGMHSLRIKDANRRDVIDALRRAAQIIEGD